MPFLAGITGIYPSCLQVGAKEKDHFGAYLPFGCPQAAQSPAKRWLLCFLGAATWARTVCPIALWQGNRGFWGHKMLCWTHTDGKKNKIRFLTLELLHQVWWRTSLVSCPLPSSKTWPEHSDQMAHPRWYQEGIGGKNTSLATVCPDAGAKWDVLDWKWDLETGAGARICQGHPECEQILTAEPWGSLVQHLWVC